MKKPTRELRISQHILTGSGSRTPDPDAMPGSLLEMVQLARQRCAGAGGMGYEGREQVLAVAESHRAQLNAAPARLGLRAYVLTTTGPWEALWLQIASALGLPHDPPARCAPGHASRRRCEHRQRLRARVTA